MKISARNVLRGTVTAVAPGAINAEVVLALDAHTQLTAVVTNDAVKELGLTVGAKALGVVKASSIILAVGLGPAKLSARNLLEGTVSKVVHGAVSSEVELTLSGGATVVSVVTRSSAERLALAPGSAVTAIIKASSVMVGVDG